VPTGLGEVVHLVFAGVHAARRHFVQQRLPKMGPSAVHQGDAHPPAPGEVVAGPGDELQARRPAAHHDDPVQGLVFNRRIRAGCQPLEVPICHPSAVIGLALQPVRYRFHSGQTAR
jgi:hypothetical protein